MVGDDIGDGEQRSIIEEQIEQADLKDCVLITGWVDNPLDYAGSFDVATLLSRWEGFGLVLPEYMLLGKPIVATKADAIPYVIGEAGILVDIDDYKQAAKEITMLYKHDETCLKNINLGIQRARMFDAKKTADEHIKLWR